MGSNVWLEIQPMYMLGRVCSIAIVLVEKRALYNDYGRVTNGVWVLEDAGVCVSQEG